MSKKVFQELDAIYHWSSLRHTEILSEKIPRNCKNLILGLEIDEIQNTNVTARKRRIKTTITDDSAVQRLQFDENIENDAIDIDCMDHQSR